MYDRAKEQQKEIATINATITAPMKTECFLPRIKPEIGSKTLVIIIVRNAVNSLNSIKKASSAQLIITFSNNEYIMIVKVFLVDNFDNLFRANTEITKLIKTIFIDRLTIELL